MKYGFSSWSDKKGDIVQKIDAIVRKQSPRLAPKIHKKNIRRQRHSTVLVQIPTTTRHSSSSVDNVGEWSDDDNNVLVKKNEKELILNTRSLKRMSRSVELSGLF
jgi:hypothetical protein